MKSSKKLLPADLQRMYTALTVGVAAAGAYVGFSFIDHAGFMRFAGDHNGYEILGGILLLTTGMMIGRTYGEWLAKQNQGKANR